MITLGLGNIIPKRREPSHSGLQTLLEMVERLEPSPVVLWALSETVIQVTETLLPRSPNHKVYVI